MVKLGLIDRCLAPLAAAGIKADVFSDTIPEPVDTVIEAGVAVFAKAPVRLPDRVWRRLADRYRQGDGDPGFRRR